MAITIDQEACENCGACIDCCPNEALQMQDDKLVLIEDECIECGVCVDECPEGAIAL